MGNLISTILKEKCPFCEKGNVFKKVSFLHLPEMNEQCPVCKRDFTGEPGYYFGAMYVSYGIAVITAISAFLICRFIFGIKSVNITIASCIISIILISFKNFRWSRIIWLKIFPPGANTNFSNKQLK